MSRRCPGLLITAVLLATAGFTLHAGSAQAQEGCTANPANAPFWDPPPAGTVQLYDQQNYIGNCIRLRLNVYPHTGYSGLGDFGWNDRVVSVELGAGVRVVLFEDWRFLGWRNRVVNSTPSFFNRSLSFSSARLESTDVSTSCDHTPWGMFGFHGVQDGAGDCFIWDPSRNQNSVWQFYQVGLANDTLIWVTNRSNRDLVICHTGNCQGGLDFMRAGFEGDVTGGEATAFYRQ